MNRLARLLLWGFVAAITAWSVVYFLRHFSSASFAESAMGNLFATILGVLVGVPIALEISRRQQDAVHVVATTERRDRDAERKRVLLTLLRSELVSNRDDVVTRREPVDSGGKRVVTTQSLKDQLWSAFSDGGELQYVNNPGLLAALANAYHQIRHCIMLERRVLDAVHFPGMRIQQDKYPQDFLLEYLTSSDPTLLSEVGAAISGIDSELTSLAASR
jgi:hypothetical protein